MSQHTELLDKKEAILNSQISGIEEEVFRKIKHRAQLRSRLNNQLFNSKPQQDKLLDYLVALELRIEHLEQNVEKA